MADANATVSIASSGGPLALAIVVNRPLSQFSSRRELFDCETSLTGENGFLRDAEKSSAAMVFGMASPGRGAKKGGGVSPSAAFLRERGARLAPRRCGG